MVWHYNPISFMHCYAEALPARALPAPTTAPAPTEGAAECSPEAGMCI
jgi:hypothetical protein